MPGALPAHSEPSPKLQNRHWVEFRCKNRCRQAQRIAAVITEGLEICVGSIRGQRFLDVESPFVGNRCNIDSLFVQDFPQGRVCFFEPRESPGAIAIVRIAVLIHDCLILTSQLESLPARGSISLESLETTSWNCR